MSKYFALVPAAGSGQRFSSLIPKQYQLINDKPLLWYTLQALDSVPEISLVVVVISAEDRWFDSFNWELSKVIVLRCGGETRSMSVRNGLLLMQKNYSLDAQDWILIHDAARCCISVELVQRLINELAEDEVGGLLALPVSDTVKLVDAAACVAQTIPRKNLWLAQTPQMFRVTLLTRALILDTSGDCTDESSAVEALGYKPRLVPGAISNFKVTYPQDAVLASVLLVNKSY